MTNEHEGWRARRFTIGEALGRGLGAVLADTAAAILIERARLGGDDAATAMRLLIESSRRTAGTMRDRAVRAERALAAHQEATRRSHLMAQAVLLPVPNPPEGHRWVTGVDGGVAGAEFAGHLLCAVCTGVERGGQAPGSAVVSASECLITAVGA